MHCHESGYNRMNHPPEHYIYGTDGPVVILSGRVASILENAFLDQFRRQIRGRDPELDSVLTAVRIAALSYRQWREGSRLGTTFAEQGEQEGQLSSRTEIGARAAAELLNMTVRGVRKAITEGRLPAELKDGQWVIQRDDVLAYKTRAA